MNYVKLVNIIILRFIFSRDQVFTLCKVMDALEEGEEFDDVTGIAIEPPKVRAETDEDLGQQAHRILVASSRVFTAKKSRF